jgi:methyl-accepting chemotaxis protein
MFHLSNWRFLHKLLLLVGAMSVVIAGVAAVGFTGIHELVADAFEVASTGKESLLGALINENALMLSRDEFRIAADPTAETIAAVTTAVAEQRKQFEDRVATIKQTADTEQKAKIDDIEAAYSTYVPALQATLDTAQKLGAQVQDDAAQQQIIDAAHAGRAQAEALIAKVHAYADFSSQRADSIAAGVEAQGGRLQTLMIIVSTLGILGGIAIGYLLASFAIARPIAASVARLKLLSEGDTAGDIPGLGRKDEVGAIAGTMEVFRENLIRNREMQEREKQEQITRTKRAQTIETVTEKFDRAASDILKAVSASATELQSTATAMTATAEETARQATVVASASEETTANVQTVAAATEELTASIREISNQVTESSSIVGQAVHEAEDTNGKVQSLAEAAQKIGQVVSIISEIASQTNLLALNATIEAARAGEAGKGFAVVASEVKTLATQTAKATEEITTQVQSIQAATSSSAQAIRGIGTTINRVNEISGAIAAAIEEQGAATQEIARNVQEAAQATQEVSTNIVSVTTAAEHTGAAATEVLTASNELARQAALMRQEVESYISSVRAA